MDSAFKPIGKFTHASATCQNLCFHYNSAVPCRGGQTITLKSTEVGELHSSIDRLTRRNERIESAFDCCSIVNNDRLRHIDSIFLKKLHADVFVDI